MTPVLQCLSTLRSAFDCGYSEEYNGSQTRKKWDLSDGESLEGIDCLREDVSTHRQHAVENGEETQSLQNIVIPGITIDTSLDSVHFFFPVNISRLPIGSYLN